MGGDVTVTPTSADLSALTVSGALTFTASDWSTAQTVTVSGGDYGGVTVASVTGRMESVASGQPGPASLRFGATPSQTVEDEWGFLPLSDPDTVAMSEMLDGASFTLPLGASGSGTADASGPALWGRGERVSLSGTEEDVSWDGELWSAHLGADMRIRSDLLAGAALSYAEGEVDTQTTGGDGVRVAGTYETKVTSVHPYVSRILPDGSNLWISAGYGSGEVRITDEGMAGRRAGLKLWNIATGGRKVLLEGSDMIAGGASRLALKGEGSLAQVDTEADAGLTELTVKTSRLRVMLEGSHERGLAGGGSLTPALEMGIRFDDGDIGQGLGLEVGASVIWSAPATGWTTELRSRMLAAHEKDRDEWGVSALARLEPGAGGRGVYMKFGPSYGQTDSGLGQLFDYSLPATTSAAKSDETSSLEAEMGYGFAVNGWRPGGLLTPYAGLSLVESGEDALRLGSRYKLGDGLDVGLEATHRPEGGDKLMLRATLRW